MRPFKLFVCAGEASGDALLAAALRSLREELAEGVGLGDYGESQESENLAETPEPRELLLCGAGGPLSAAQGLVSCVDFNGLAVNGITDVLRALPRLVIAARKLERALRAFNPDAVLLVDYPGLNTRLWRTARALGKPVHYLAPPQLWSRRSGAALARRYAPLARGSTVQVLFPFEASLWLGTGARVLQGHPFDTRLLPDVTSYANLQPHFLLCPGSRPQVMRRNLRAYLRALGDLERKYSAFAPGIAPALARITVLVPENLRSSAEGVVARFQSTQTLHAHIQVITDKRVVLQQGRGKAVDTATHAATDSAIHAAPLAPTLAICQPGTITLELALAGLPFIAVGVVDALTLVLGKYRVATPHLALPNVLLGKRLYPEWVGLASQFTGDTLAELLLALNQVEPQLATARPDLVAAMGEGGSGQVTAQSLAFLSKRNRWEKKLDLSVRKPRG
jgi:lipid-A-disaccharide synthase